MAGPIFNAFKQASSMCHSAACLPALMHPVHCPQARQVFADVPISLHRQCHGSTEVWDCIASGTTNSDGRIGDLLPASDFIEPGMYK